MNGVAERLGCQVPTRREPLCAALVTAAACVAGKAECVPDIAASDEVCNGEDDDCNGDFDDLPHAMSDSDGMAGIAINAVSVSGKTHITVKAGASFSASVGFEFTSLFTGCDFRVLAGFFPGAP
ncbi:MAG: hypothetical protein FJ095_01775 [Deltaproteobacteria bacterium]|nr:hypothetical protein [Deltaproteobacteria bacterium]